MKKTLALILLLAALCFAMPLPLYAAGGTFTVALNGEKTDIRARVVDGYLYMPLASFCRALGAEKTEKTKSGVTVSVRGITVSAGENSFLTEANGRVFYNGGCNQYIDGELCIPMATVYRIFDCAYFAAGNGILYIDDTGSVCASGDDTYNADDLYWLSRIISAESRGEPEKGKIAVGNVVCNRVALSSFPNSIYGVIFDKKYGVQFTPAANGTIYAAPTAESTAAAKAVLDGANLSSDILYFYSPTLAPNAWAGRARPYAFQIGDHIFCK